MFATRRYLSWAVVSIVAILLAIATITPIFSSLSTHLPARAHYFFHLVAHSLLVIALFHALPNAPAEFSCATSVLVAVLIEVVQGIFVKDRSADLGDLAAATVGSFVVFLIPRDGASYTTPSLQALTNFIYPPVDDDDDDDDGHRVHSWAV